MIQDIIFKIKEKDIKSRINTDNEEDNFIKDKFWKIVGTTMKFHNVRKSETINGNISKQSNGKQDIYNVYW